MTSTYSFFWLLRPKLRDSAPCVQPPVVVAHWGFSLVYPYLPCVRFSSTCPSIISLSIEMSLLAICPKYLSIDWLIFVTRCGLILSSSGSSPYFSQFCCCVFRHLISVLYPPKFVIMEPRIQPRFEHQVDCFKGGLQSSSWFFVCLIPCHILR